MIPATATTLHVQHCRHAPDAWLAANPAMGEFRSLTDLQDLAEIAALKKEVARLRAERDILKKAAAFFAREAT